MGVEGEERFDAWLESMFDSDFFSSGEFSSPGSSDEEIVASGTIDPVYRISEPKASTELPLLVLWDNQTSNQIRAPVYLVPTNYSVLCRNLNPSGMERPLRVSLKKRWSWTPERQALFEQSFKEVSEETNKKPTAKQILLKLLPLLPDLDRGKVSSHLQKHLQKLKKKAGSL